MKKGAHIHLMGICGTAMASLAGLLKQRGYRVTGSDTACYPPMSDQLRDLGITIQQGYVKENLQPAPDLVVVGNVITAKYEEAVALMQSEISYTSFPKAMGEFVIGDKDCVVIAGTHGKTTTTSMMAWVAENQGKDSGFLIGGIAKNFNRSFQDSDGDLFIIEGDEYDTAFFDKVPKFIYYKPKYVTLTSVEFDHIDIYSSMQDVRDAFVRLIELIPADGHLLVYAQDSEATKLAEKSNSPVYTYGIGEGDFSARNIVSGPKGTVFDIYRDDAHLAQLELPMSGEHNVLNALSVVGHSEILGWSLQKTCAALREFRGIKRRQEVIGTPGGVTVVEDFAHHPTAVKKTLDGLRSQYAGGKLHAVFEPRSATSRRDVFQQEYASAFAAADRTYIAEPYDTSRIDPEQRFSSEQLVESLCSKGQQAFLLPGADEIVKQLANEAASGDVVVVMSNGGFDNIYEKLLDSLEASSGV